jgi:DHA2 family multidrug resistance protein
MFFMLGALLFSGTVIMPQFLQTQLGYTAELAGLVLSGGAFVLLFALPVVGQLTTKMPAKYIIAFGWLVLALAMYYSTQRIDLLISFRSATWLRITQVIGIGFLFVPITLVAYVGMPADKSNAVAGMVNFMRNIGSSVGTSMVTTVIARRSQFHQSNLVSHATASSLSFQNYIAVVSRNLTRYGLSPHDALVRAYATAYRQLQRQAATMAYIDTYWILAVGASIMFVLAFFMKKNDPHGGGEEVAL